MNLIPGSAAAIFTACTAFHIPTLVGCVPVENTPLKSNGFVCSFSTMFERSMLRTPSLAITGVSDDDSAATEPMKLNIITTQITEKISIPATTARSIFTKSFIIFTVLFCSLFLCKLILPNVNEQFDAKLCNNTQSYEKWGYFLTNY